MAIRKDSLRKIVKILQQRRAELARRLGMDLGDLGQRSTGDAADIAFSSIGDDLSSRLAELEGRELAQIELALQRIKQGRYGICDTCEKRIPAGRLTAVPYSIMCVKCQTEAERSSNWLDHHAGLDWSGVRDGEERETVDFRAMEYEHRK